MAVTTWSAPAQQKPFTVTNSDGTRLTITLCGDECCHFYATLCEPEGARCYVVDIVIGYDGSKNMKLVDY